MIKKELASNKRLQEQSLIKAVAELKYRVTTLIDSPQDVDDVLQEIFVKAFVGLKHFNHQASLSTWLYRIAQNEVKNFYSKKNKEKNRLITFDENLENTLEYSYFCQEQIIHLLQSRAKKEEQNNNKSIEYDDFLYLREVLGLSYQEISKQMQCPVGTVRSRLHRARKLMVS